MDTHYLYVKNRIQTLNPARKVVGIMPALDWPPKNVQMEAFYLLILGETPLGKQAYSATIPVKVHTVQWTWMIAGTDIQVGVQLRSRGDKYRTNFTMKGELENGLYPGFGPKVNVVVNSSGDLVGVPADPTEYIMWSPLSIVDKNDKGSGLMYGIGTVRITDMTDAITS